MQLLKSSLQTYLNAMTYPDRTVYPVASPNTKDFYHLVDVYLDAVFFPRLQPWILKQEGWHLEPAGGAVGAAEEGAAAAAVEASASTTTSSTGSSTSGAAAPGSPPISFKGVVFNEMKGVYSSASSIRSYATEKALLPDTIYALSSGGDPLAIPQLSFQEFQAFHSSYYRPSNARAFFFGNDDPLQRLQILEQYFLDFEAQAGAGPGAASAAGAAGEGSNTYLQVAANAAAVAGQVTVGAGGRPVIASQKPWSAPRRVSMPYPVEAEEGEEEGAAAAATPAAAGGSGKAPDKHDFTLNWVVNFAPDHGQTSSSSSSSSAGAELSPALLQPLDDVTRMGLYLLNHLLMGTQVATLYKDLVESGLGSSVIGGGMDGDMLHPSFSVGLKAVKEKDLPAVEAKILESLHRTSEQGFSQEHLESAFNTIEFGLREFASGGGPRGLSLFLSSVSGWIYGRDPVEELKFERPLKQLKQRVQEDPSFLPGLIKTFLLQNPHRAAVHMYPDPAFGSKREREEQALLQKRAEGMSEKQLAEVAQEAEELLQRQATPDSPEALATIPTLTLEDLPKTTRSIGRHVKAVQGEKEGQHIWRPAFTSASCMASSVVKLRDSSTSSSSSSSFSSSSASAAGGSFSSPATTDMLLHEQPSNGIGYSSLFFDLSPLPQRLLPLLPLFQWGLLSMGTSNRTEVAMNHSIGTHTGGIHASASMLEVPGDRTRLLPLFEVSGKALGDKAGRLAELMQEILSSAKFDRKDLVRQTLKRGIAGHESGLVSSGNRYGSSMLGAYYSKKGWVNEVLGGVTQLQVMRQLLEQVDSGSNGGFEALSADLQSMRDFILSRSNVLASVTGDAETLRSMEGAMEGLLNSLPTLSAGTGPAALPGAGLRLLADGRTTAAARFGSNWHWPSSSSDALAAATAAAAAGNVGASASSSSGSSSLPMWPFSKGSDSSSSSSNSSDCLPPRLGVVVPTQVNYVVKAGAALPLGSTGSGATEVVGNILSTDYLWHKVRVTGGAYGASAGFSRMSGLLSFGSYRDPNLGGTVATFDGVGDYLKGLLQPENAETLKEDLRQSIISTIGGIDAPMSPEARGEVSAARYLTGISDEMVQKRRQEVLGSSAADVEAFAEAAEVVRQTGRVVVVGSEAAFAEYHSDKKNEPFQLVYPLQKDKKEGKGDKK